MDHKLCNNNFNEYYFTMLDFVKFLIKMLCSNSFVSDKNLFGVYLWLVATKHYIKVFTLPWNPVERYVYITFIY